MKQLKDWWVCATQKCHQYFTDIIINTYSGTTKNQLLMIELRSKQFFSTDFMELSDYQQCSNHHRQMCWVFLWRTVYGLLLIKYAFIHLCLIKKSFFCHSILPDLIALFFSDGFIWDLSIVIFRKHFKIFFAWTILKT